MRSVVLRINPLALLVIGLAAVIGSLGVKSLTAGLLAVGLYALLIALFTPSLRFAAICLAIALFAALTVFYSTWRLGGHDEVKAAVAGLRIVMLAWPGAVAAGYIDPMRLGDYLAQNLKLPARPVVAVTSTIGQVTTLADSFEQLRRTRRARGVSGVRVGAQLVFALMVTSLRQASSRSIAMDARGFATAQQRSWAEPAPWSKFDVATVILGVAVAALPFLAALPFFSVGI